MTETTKAKTPAKPKAAKRQPIPPALQAELASLTPEQLISVGKLVAGLTGGRFIEPQKAIKAESGGAHARAEALYEALASELYQKRKVTTRRFGTLLAQQDKLAKQLLEKHAAFDLFLDQATGSHNLTDAERFKLYAMAANLLAAALVNAQLGMSMMTMVNWLSNVPALFDKSFPGYIRSGLLHVIITATLQKPVVGHKGALVEVRRDEDVAREKAAIANGKRSASAIRESFRNRRAGR